MPPPQTKYDFLVRIRSADIALCTPDPNYRQVIFSITSTFSMVLISVHVCETRSDLREIIPLALFEKNSFFTLWKGVAIFHLNLLEKNP